MAEGHGDAGNLVAGIPETVRTVFQQALATREFCLECVLCGLMTKCDIVEGRLYRDRRAIFRLAGTSGM